MNVKIGMIPFRLCCCEKERRTERDRSDLNGMDRDRSGWIGIDRIRLKLLRLKLFTILAIPARLTISSELPPPPARNYLHAGTASHNNFAVPVNNMVLLSSDILRGAPY